MFAQQPQEAGPIEECLDLALVVAGLLVLPVEQGFAGGVPGDAIEEIDQLRHLEDLGRSEHFRGFFVVAADLLDAFRHTVGLGRLLRLGHGYGQTVDEKDHVGAPVANGGAAACSHSFGDVEEILVGPVEVDEADVDFAVLGGDEDGPFAAEPGQGVAVALDGRAQQVQPADDLGGAVAVEHPGVKADKLGGEVVGEEHQAAVAAAAGPGHRRAGRTASRWPPACSTAHGGSVPLRSVRSWDGLRLDQGGCGTGGPVISSSSRREKSSSCREHSRSTALIFASPGVESFHDCGLFIEGR